nr:hypothetical protein [Tanacetum cinerariifolium]
MTTGWTVGFVCRGITDEGEGSTMTTGWTVGFVCRGITDDISRYTHKKSNTLPTPPTAAQPATTTRRRRPPPKNFSGGIFPAKPKRLLVTRSTRSSISLSSTRHRCHHRTTTTAVATPPPTSLLHIFFLSCLNLINEKGWLFHGRQNNNEGGGVRLGQQLKGGGGCRQPHKGVFVWLPTTATRECLFRGHGSHIRDVCSWHQHIMGCLVELPRQAAAYYGVFV